MCRTILIMYDQPERATIPSQRRKNVTILSGFAALLIAILGITALTNNTTEQKVTVSVATVRITARGFEPATLAVKAGTKVTWTSTDNSLHQIAANPYPKGSDLPNLRSDILTNNQTYTYAATTTGNFNYHDQLNPTVNGTLVVQKR